MGILKQKIEGKILKSLRSLDFYIYRSPKDPELIEKGLIRNAGHVLHIGAHKGQERDIYRALGVKVKWIEVQPNIYEELAKNLIGYPMQEPILALCGSENKKVDFFVTSNDGGSSSIFKLLSTWKEISITSKISLQMMRLDTIFKHDDLKNFKHWVIDVQGAELEVLRGAGDLLKDVGSMRIEVSTLEAYEGGVTYYQLNEFMLLNGFKEISRFPKNAHGDTIYIRDT